MSTRPARLSFARRFGPSLVVLIAGLATSIIVLTLQRSAEIMTARQRFYDWAEDHREDLQRTIDAQLQVLYGARALFDSSESVNSQEFNRFVTPGLNRRRHIESIDWLPRVAAAEADQFAARASEEFGIDVTFDAPAADGTHYPVLFHVPANRPIGSSLHPATMQRAERTREAALVPFESDAQVPDMLIIYLPVYDAEVLKGFLRMFLSFASVKHTVLNDAAREGIEVQFATRAQQPTSSADIAPLQLPNRFVPWVSAAPFRGVDNLTIADQRIGVRIATAPNYVWRPRLAGIWIWFAAATLMSLIAAAVAYYFSLGRLRLQSLAKSLTVEIEERRTSEQRLQETEARFRLLVENSPDAVILYRNGRIGYINPAGVQLLHVRSEAEVLGRDVIEFLHAEDRARARQRLSITAQERRVLPPAIERLHGADGSIMEVEVLTVPFEADGETTLHITARDITQRRQAEAEREKLQAALRQSQKLEAIGTLAGGIAHDFNNILSAIVGNTRLLLGDLPESHPARHSVAEIRRATQRARELVKRLMTFSRDQDAQRTAIALAPLIGEVQHLLRAMLPAGVRLGVDVPANLSSVFADPTQLHQVLVNLCTNAWQAMPTNSGTITITARPLSRWDAEQEAAVPAGDRNDYVRIEVRDDGSGIAPELLDHIFEPFFTTKPPGEGSGLGLAVVHGIVQSHRGAIRVDSEPGHGTSFFVYLPATADEPSTTATLVAERVRGREQHVLYVDDEESLVFLVERTLRRAGFRCTAVTDVHAALEEVVNDPASFDLVITDLNMPGMSGLDFARQVLSIRPELPVLITSGYVRASDVAAARELGVRDLVLKPDTVDELAAVVQRYL